LCADTVGEKLKVKCVLKQRPLKPRRRARKVLIFCVISIPILLSPTSSSNTDSTQGNSVSAVVTSTENPSPTLTPTRLPTLIPTRLPALTSSVGPIIDEWEGVYLGMCADDVLEIHPKSETVGEPEVLGTDAEGLIVSWNYTSASLILNRRWGEDGIYCYRVQEIRLHR
jgi:hypothetical protein